MKLTGWLVFALGAAISSAAFQARADAQVPLATPADLAAAPLMVSRDGRTVTIRAVASDDLRICVEPTTFAAVHCWTVRELRAGRLR